MEKELIMENNANTQWWTTLEEGFLRDKWVDIKGFGTRREAEELKRILEQ